MNKPIHTSDVRRFKKMWLSHGGSIHHVRRTGEIRYEHPFFVDTVRVNDRRKDVVAVMLSRLNQVLSMSNQEDGGPRKPH